MEDGPSPRAASQCASNRPDIDFGRTCLWTLPTVELYDLHDFVSLNMDGVLLTTRRPPRAAWPPRVAWSVEECARFAALKWSTSCCSSSLSGQEASTLTTARRLGLSLSLSSARHSTAATNRPACQPTADGAGGDCDAQRTGSCCSTSVQRPKCSSTTQLQHAARSAM